MTGASFRRGNFPWPLLLLAALLAAPLLLTRCSGQDPFAARMAAANRAFADGDYGGARAEFSAARQLRPDDRGACFGEALALLQLGEADTALMLFDQLAGTGSAVERAYTLANRGILHDRAGRYPQALADYDAAVRLHPAVADGPGFLTRFLRNQEQRPPSIADRARYLRAELARPPAERRLRQPDADARQRPYAP